ncbi:hypothetical protein V5O48_018694 [Marasmius crinis-equi]|uniref:Uncharacterized protein n=1 Tax=Marasmius crinis-equi TaxID=585013 RepID=A0ABR3EKJ6_9AGAR
MQFSAKLVTLAALVAPAVLASPVPGGTYWDEDCGCEKPHPTVVPIPPGSNINAGNQCGQYGTQNNFCFNGGKYSALTDSCNGSSVYCCQSNPIQNGVFNSNTGNCQTITVNNYGSTSTSSSSSSSGSGLNGGLLGAVGGLVNKVTSAL